MTARARIRDDFTYDGVAIMIASPMRHGGEELLDFTAVERRVVDELVEPPPTAPLRLSHDQARALYAELARHYGGIHDTAGVQALRGDYDHERRRVDKLIDFVIREDTP